MSKNLYLNALSKKLPLYLTYGMTEASFQPKWSDKLYLGSPLLHFELKIEKEKLYIRRTSLFQGYFPNKTKYDWLPTGDLAEFHPEKRVTPLRDAKITSSFQEERTSGLKKLSKLFSISPASAKHSSFPRPIPNLEADLSPY